MKAMMAVIRGSHCNLLQPRGCGRGQNHLRLINHMKAQPQKPIVSQFTTET